MSADDTDDTLDHLRDFRNAQREKRDIGRLGVGNGLQSATVATPWPALNRMLGGGLPRGTIAEVLGPEHAGKTCLTQALCLHVQQGGGKAAFIDFDGSFSPERASGLLYGRPRNADEAFDIAEALALSNSVDLVAVDSVAGLITEGEAQGRSGIRRLASLLRRLKHLLRDRCACVLFTRTAEGPEEFLDQSHSLGADWHALAHCAATRIQLDVAPEGTRCTTLKCKLAPPNQSVLIRVDLARERP